MTLRDKLSDYARRRARQDAEVRQAGAIPAAPPWKLTDTSPTRRFLAHAYYAELIRVDDAFAAIRGA